MFVLYSFPVSLYSLLLTILIVGQEHPSDMLLHPCRRRMPIPSNTVHVMHMIIGAHNMVQIALSGPFHPWKETGWSCFLDVSTVTPTADICKAFITEP